MLIRECARFKSANISMFDEEVLRTKKTVKETRTILAKYWRCKLCSFVNLSDAKIRCFGDIISKIWMNNILAVNSPFYLKKYTKVGLPSVFLCLKIFLYLISNFSSDLVSNNIKISIVSFFLNMKFLSKGMLRKCKISFAFPRKLFI